LKTSFDMPKISLHSIITMLLLLLSQVSFSQTLELGTLTAFEAYAGTGAVTNSGEITGDAGTSDGIISGGGFGTGYSGTTHNNTAVTTQ
jgi:hypothetical protein